MPGSGKKTIKSILKVSISNIIKLLAGVLVGFLLPKIIGVDDYGYYKTFALYITYVGIFHFGIVDGIYLKFGGDDYKELDAPKFRLYTRVLILMEIILSLIGVLVSVLALSGNTRFIFASVSVFILAYNVVNYYQVISQITRRFSELSVINIIQSVLTVIGMVGIWLIYHFEWAEVNYKYYTLIYVGIQLLLCFIYVFIYRNITFGKANKIADEKMELGRLIISGIPLLIANLCLILILNIDRQFVNVLFDNEVYAKYAFAYTLISLISTATTAIATVLYPTMKRMELEKLKSSFDKFTEIILIFVFACLMIYFPLRIFINWFLPKYSDSLDYFRILLPGIAVSALITIVIQNYYKVMNKNFSFFIVSIITLILAFTSNLVCYLIFKNTYSISIASIAVMVTWYFILVIYLRRVFEFKFIFNTIYMLVSTAAFYGLSFIGNDWLGLGLHILAFILITGAFYFKDFLNLIRRNKKNNLNLNMEVTPVED